MQRLSDYSNLMLILKQNQRLIQKWEQRSRLTLRQKDKLLLLQKPNPKQMLSLKLMLKQKQKVMPMSIPRLKLMLMLMQRRREKQIDLNLVIWANPAATHILSITLVKNLLAEVIKLMSINGPITIQVA